VLSIAILLVGMLGVASLIPIGKMSMTATNNSDRTGMCGRAGLRDVKVRRLLNTAAWIPAPVGNIAFIDPLGFASALGTTTVGGTTTNSYLQRINFNLGGVAANDVFRWHDDLTYGLAKDSPNPTNGDRPMPVMSGSVQQSDGKFSWFFTVAASPGEVRAGIPWYQASPLLQRRQFSVSVVVCWNRDFAIAADGRSPDPEGEQTCAVTLSGFGIGGGTISLQTPLDTTAGHPINKVKDNQWVMLVGLDSANNPIVGNWYRVVGVGRDLTQASQPVNMLSLVGPDWNGTGVNSVDVVVIEGVTGVYTTTVQLDNDATWTR
jgi:hypothetical protein